MHNFLKQNKKELGLLLAVFVVFLLLRLPGTDLPYHQDEYKSAISVEQGSEAAGNFFSHPPLTQLIFRGAHALFGGEHLRFFPIVFSSLSFFLLYYFLRIRSGRKVAILGVALFTISIYSVWGSLMLDTDGAVLPFFFLLALCTYEKFTTASLPKKKYLWLTLLILSLLLGFLVKLSFILVIGAIALDFLWGKRKNVSRKQIIYVSGFLLGLLVVAALLILLLNYLYPAFRIDSMIKHAQYFFHLSGRDYVQVLVQASKALFYLSPVFLVPLFFISKEVFTRTRVQFLYIILGFIFYFILLDFSRGALDKYLMFLIVPLAIIVSTILAPLLSWKNKKFIALGAGLGLILVLLNFIPHAVVPLYPKTDWFGKVFSLHWNFLNPFMGGSGPLGFYVSFLLIAFAFITSAIAVASGFMQKQWKSGALIVILAISLVYNVVFIEELLIGKINGSSAKVLHDSLDFIRSSSSIESVITYNDSGAYELHHMNKYKARFYAVPAFEYAHKPLFEEHNGYFLVVGVPLISPEFFHGKFFAVCDTIYQSTSGKITAYIYDCKK